MTRSCFIAESPLSLPGNESIFGFGGLADVGFRNPVDMTVHEQEVAETGALYGRLPVGRGSGGFRGGRTVPESHVALIDQSVGKPAACAEARIADQGDPAGIAHPGHFGSLLKVHRSPMSRPGAPVHAVGEPLVVPPARNPDSGDAKQNLLPGSARFGVITELLAHHRGNPARPVVIHRGGIDRKQEIVIGCRVQLEYSAHLLQVRHAVRAVRPFPRLVQRRQQHRCEDCDDRDHHYDHLLNIQCGVY